MSQFEKVSPGVEELAVVRALTSVSPKMQKNAFVLIDVGGGINITNATATANVFSPGNNFASVYDTLSFGSMLYTGDVLGPFTYPMSTCDYNGVAHGDEADDHHRHVRPLHVVLRLDGRCVRLVGNRRGGNAADAGERLVVQRQRPLHRLVQEVGHNNGWMHSSTLAARARRSPTIPSPRLHHQRVRQPLLADGLGLRPFRRHGQVVRRLLRRLQRREGHVERDVQPVADRDPLQRHPGDPDRDAEDHAHVHGASRTTVRRRSRTTTSSCA